ncbi:uncharacterized protein LOC117109683 [Anneissia japonica]|uniref:uncharacterized protein LOC117109683 n=1 Tax=Anneissia japonica TaxID=1529436 RepID=UPI001425839C|nr:uncharacterized protein LOC117109683 [Anneissia japonica]
MDSHESYAIPFGDFTDVLPIGCAGSGTVIHKALWTSQNNRQVAIKIYNKQLHDKEVNILRKLDHPNIIKFFGIVNPPFSSGIVIEYASGGDLLNFLASKRKEKVGVRLPRRQFTHWCLDIASGIQYLHARRITHKDIKSPNVLLSDDIIHEKGEESLKLLKICDFGISKELTSTESVVSRFGGCTKSWAAPEVITDDRVVSQKSDIYSVCVVFWELWTCQQPWSDHLISDIETKVKRGILLEIPKDFPELMKPMMLKCWQMERHRRCKIDDIIACIKSLMSEWQIKVCHNNTSRNQGNTQSGMITEESVEEDKIMKEQTRLEDQKPDDVPVQKKQHVEQTFIETEWVDATSHDSKSLEITKNAVKEATCFQSSAETDKQEACNYEKEEDYTNINEDDAVYYTIKQEEEEDYSVVDDEKSDPNEIRCQVVASKSNESIQQKHDDLDSTMQAAENAAELKEHEVIEGGHVAYIVNRIESLNVLDDNAVETLRRKISGKGNNINNEGEENTTTTGGSEVAPILPVLPVGTYQNLTSPVPNLVDYYDDIDGTCVPPEGKSGEELRKLYEHVEKSYTDLKLVKEECIDNDRFNGVLNSGELRHLMTNMYDVENIMSRFYTWFNQCKGKIPAICQLITNILEADYLQPIIDFVIYSQLQMNMLKCIRYGHLHFEEKFTSLQKRGSEENMNYKLSFKDLQEIILKQANWLKKFHSILKSFCDALVVEKVEDTSVIEDMKECCCKLHQIIQNCNEHESRIIRDIQHHSTSILQKLRLESVDEKERESQKAMVIEESWVKKTGTIYLTEDIKQSKKHSVIDRRKKCTIMTFVSTVIIVEDKGEYLRVIDCIHKNNVKFERQVYQNMGSTGGETLILTKLDPLTKLPVKEYGFTLEDSNEIQEWAKAFEFSKEEKQCQDTEYATPINIGLLDTAHTEPTYEDCYRTKYARMESLYENLEAMQVLASIISLNKQTIESLSKLIELYADNVVLSSIIGEGEKHHLYLNVRECFNNCLESNQCDSFNLFTELRKQLDNDSFHPIIEYQAHLCFQRNMLQFQRKHPTAFSQALGNLERNAHAKWRVSQKDFQMRLSKPADWLTRLYHNLKSLEAAIIRDPDHQEIFHRLNANTLHMLHQLILRGQLLKESVEQDYSKHVTSVLLMLPTETMNEPHIQKLSNIQDDWIQKHDRMVMFRKRKKDLVNNPLKKRYHSTQINLFVSTSVIILTSSSAADETVENLKTQRFCRCFDRNYADVGIVDAKSRESWMPERENLFKLWIYEKEGVDYKQYEYVIGLNSDRSMEDLLEWKSALVVATGESGKFDDYRRPSHIVTESFITDRKDELHLEIDDIIEILEMQDALGKTWVKGMRLSDEKSGWFPSNKLGHEVDSEYSRGQAVKLRYQKERERKKESNDEEK